MTDLEPAVLHSGGLPPRRRGALVTLAQRIDAIIVRERLRNYSLIIVAFGAVTVLATAVLAPDKVLTDYLAHWTGGRMLLEGRGGLLYDAALQLDLQRQVIGETDELSWFVSPPFVAVLYASLAALPFGFSGMVWTALSIGALALSAQLARPLAPAWLQESWRLVLLVAAASAPVLRLLGSGQDSALLLLVWVAGTRLLLARRDAAAGVVLALGLVKPQLVFLLPLVLLVQGRWRALGAFAATGIALLGLSVAAVGPSVTRTFLLLPFSDDYHHGVQLGQAWLMQGITALLTTLLPTSGAIAGQLVGSVLSAAAVLALLVRVARRRGRSVGDAQLWALVAVVTVLVSPHVLDYDLVVLFPAVLTALSDRRDTATRLTLLALFVTTWTIPIRHVIAILLPWPLSTLGATWSTVALLVLAWRVSRGWAATAATPTFAGSPAAVTTSVPHPSNTASKQT